MTCQIWRLLYLLPTHRAIDQSSIILKFVSGSFTPARAVMENVVHVLTQGFGSFVIKIIWPLSEGRCNPSLLGDSGKHSLCGCQLDPPQNESFVQCSCAELCRKGGGSENRKIFCAVELFGCSPWFQMVLEALSASENRPTFTLPVLIVAGEKLAS